MSAASQIATTIVHSYREEILSAWEIRQRSAEGLLTRVIGVDRNGRELVVRETFERAPPRPCYWWVHV